MDLDNNAHSVFLLHYHLVLVVKYRRQIFDDTYHQAEYYCYYCNAKKTEKEKHTWLYEEILGQ